MKNRTSTTDTTGWYTSTLRSMPADTVALVLAGGKGTRLRTGTDPELATIPKVLVPITSPHHRAPVPMLDHALVELATAGFRRAALLTGCAPEARADDVERYAVRAFAARLQLIAHREPYPLGTAGAVYAALAHLNAPAAVVLPADTLFPCPLLPAAVTDHLAAGAPVTWTVTTAPGPDAQNPGRIFLGPDLRTVAHALEGVDAVLPSASRTGLARATSTGAVIITPDVYREEFRQYAARLPQPGPCDLYRQFMPWLLSQGRTVGAFDIREAAPDLGTPDRLAAFGRTA
ncbi:nucleotidyltransferase family protein [Kitasatospora fiedleri]|uniref:nucleotidyltransferase family protein n=1 Tax=Kitasatospora fiedleri TaxID=2991545 RepID=UPI002499DAA4|nr:NTP transferase domain-containing protein [Kitasatospora fiedleri]